ncbi:hypothetical protein K2X85_20060 [bacterium]|nr:hypothetical protein [bacterium]
MRFLAAIIGVFVFIGAIGYGLSLVTSREHEVIETVEVRVAPEQSPLSGAISDDLLATKLTRPLNFDESVKSPWKWQENEVNISNSVIKLGLDLVDGEKEPVFTKIFPSAAKVREAVAGIEKGEASLIPSASMIFAMGREFDSGVLGALDLALVDGKNDAKIGLVDVVEKIFNKLEKTDQVRTFLAAALEIAGRKVDVFPEEVVRRNIWLNRYRNNRRVASPPVDFYTWNDDLVRAYDVETFLQDEFPKKQWFMAAQLARTLAKEENADLLRQYRYILEAFDLIYLPRRVFTIDDLTNFKLVGDESIMDMFRKRAGMHYRIMFLPPSWRREQIHFAEMLPMGVHAGLDPISELTQRSMIGFISFIPPSGRPGLEQYQAMALDALLAEKPTIESDKVLFTLPYKERLINPFFAVTKKVVDPNRYMQATTWTPTDEAKISPKLRIEPMPMFYLRSARAYNYMFRAASAILGPQSIRDVKRIMPNGQRSEKPLFDDLRAIQRLFYGLYMITCEDLGAAPTFESVDDVNREECYKEATDWLAHAFDSPEARNDDRFISPTIDVRASDKKNGDLLFLTWANLGYQLLKTSSSFVPERGPQIRGTQPGAIWGSPEASKLGESHYLLPILRFKLLELVSRGSLAPKEFREICDKYEGDPDKVAEALLALPPPEIDRSKVEEVTPQEVEASGKKKRQELPEQAAPPKK